MSESKKLQEARRQLESAKGRLHAARKAEQEARVRLVSAIADEHGLVKGKTRIVTSSGEVMVFAGIDTSALWSWNRGVGRAKGRRFKKNGEPYVNTTTVYEWSVAQ